MKTFFKTLLIILLVLVVLVGGAAAYFYFTMKYMKVENVSLERLAAADPMDPAERFTADADTGMLTIRIDLHDAASLLRSAGVTDEDVSGEIWRAMREAGFEPEAVGLDVEEDGIRLDVATYYNSIRLAGSVYVSAEMGSDGIITLTPEKVGVGFLKVPLSLIEKRANVEIPTVQLQTPGFSTLLIKGIDSMEPGNGYVTVRGEFNSDLLEILSTKRNTDPMYRWFADDYRNAINAGRLYEEGDVAGAVKTLLQPVQDGEMDMEQAMKGLLVASSGSNTGAIYASAGKLWTERLFPHLTSDAVKEAHAAMHSQCEERKTVIERLGWDIHDLDKKGRFTVKNGEILFDGKTADFSEMAPGVAEQLDFMDTEDLSLCVVEVSVAESTGLKPLKKISDSDDSFAARVYSDRVYPVGTVFRAKDGTHVAVFQVYYAIQGAHIREIRFYRIPDAMWEKMATPGKVGVVEEK